MATTPNKADGDILTAANWNTHTINMDQLKPVASTYLTANTGSIFVNLATVSGADFFQFFGRVGGVSSTALKMRFNNDAGTGSYVSQIDYSGTDVTTTSDGIFLGSVNNNANAIGILDGRIINGSNIRKLEESTFGMITGTQQRVKSVGEWQNNANMISGITLIADTGNLTANSFLTVYAGSRS